MAPAELERLKEHPEILPKYDPRVALDDGRALNLGRAWEELGVFIDGGISLPEQGPILGETPFPETDARAHWSYIEAERVAHYASELSRFDQAEFEERYHIDDNAETLEPIPGTRTGAFGDRSSYLFTKLTALARHFAAAAERGEGMLIRIGERM
jgi:hypothetical protein